jgi:hypothetical protein
MTVEVMPFNLGMDLGDVEIGVFDPFAAFHEERRAGKLDDVGVSLEVTVDLVDQVWPGLVETFVGDKQGALDASGRAVGQDVAKREVGWVKDMVGEEDAVMEADSDDVFDHDG